MAAPLNACGVEADAGQSAATGRCPRRAAELRCSGRADRLSQDRRASALRSRHDRQTTTTASRSHRCHVACKAHAAQPGARRAARSDTQRASCIGRPWPSPFGRALRSGTLGVLPRECVHPLRACTEPGSAGAQRVRWSCTPCTPAAPLSACRPHPHIARSVCAPHSVRRARSRGYRRPCDITRNYAAHLLCVRRGMRHPWRMKSRARVIRRYVTWPPARPCACESAPLLRRLAGVLHALRASARHPWLAASIGVRRLRAGSAAWLRRVLGRARVAHRSTSRAAA
jgi:hypothetical protein